MAKRLSENKKKQIYNTVLNEISEHKISPSYACERLGIPATTFFRLRKHFNPSLDSKFRRRRKPKYQLLPPVPVIQPAQEEIRKPFRISINGVQVLAEAEVLAAIVTRLEVAQISAEIDVLAAVISKINIRSESKHSLGIVYQRDK